MSESMAHRMLTKNMNSDRNLLARQAQDASEALARFAKDVDLGIAKGDLDSIVHEMQQIVTRAAGLKATQKAVELYEAERTATTEK